MLTVYPVRKAGASMSGTNRIVTNLLSQRGHMFGWVPVCLAAGIGLFFSLKFEPIDPLYLGAGLFGIFGLIASRWLHEVLAPLVVCSCLIGIGFSIAAIRTHSLEAPVLGWRYYGAIEGRVVDMDRSGSDAVRITLDNVKLDKISPNRTPKRVRVSLHGDAAFGVVPQPGMKVMTTGHLSPPSGPVEPGGFDFQRHAWFGQLGAVGYTRVPLVGLEIATSDRRLWVFQVRMAISERVRTVLIGDVGGFAAAVTTGDRSGIGQDALGHLRASNTAHLLAISGLHMGLLSGFVFTVLRLILIFLPYIGPRIPARKFAAGGALLVSMGYLAMSGGNVATERAFVMVAVALCAVMLNRRAISLRAVAIAAIIVLCLRPEALFGPGFQMSFAATTALVAVFGWMRDSEIQIGPKLAQPFVLVVISSGIAGLATAPIGAAHFNTVAHYGLIANLLSVPLMGLIIIPSAVLAAVLAPFGFEAIGLHIMGAGLRWILGVAEWVAELDGARGYVMGPSPLVLPILAVGALWIILWQGRVRLLGVAPILASFVIWTVGERPLVLIADNGSLIGVMTQDGRALSKEKGAGFVARNWLENDGDPSTQIKSANLWGEGAKRVKSVQIYKFKLVHLIGKKAVEAQGSCQAGQVIIASVKVERNLGPCIVFDPETLRAHGSVGLYAVGEEIKLISARDVSGDRIWSAWPKERPTKKAGQKTRLTLN
ncbi:MAG: competence protein ComEC [Ascidiaceihabitans sp.]